MLIDEQNMAYLENSSKKLLELYQIKEWHVHFWNAILVYLIKWTHIYGQVQLGNFHTEEYLYENSNNVY